MPQAIYHRKTKLKTAKFKIKKTESLDFSKCGLKKTK